MSLKQYLLLMTSTTLIAFLVLASVIFYFDPFVSGPLVIIFFYAGLFLSALGTFSVFGFLLRHFWGDDAVIFRQVLTSFRQAVWLSILVVAAVFLKQKQIFSGTSMLILIGALTALELYFITKRSKHVIV